MAMTARAADGELANDINTTPLIDVMLVLLTLLILTLPIQTHALKLNMPTSGSPPPSPIVDLKVDFDGSLYWNGTAVDPATLHAYFRQSLGQNPQPEIHLNADSLAKYDVVAKVLGDAQSLGVTKIGFAGVDRYEQ